MWIKSFNLRNKDVEEFAELVSIIKTDEPFSINFDKFVKKAEDFRKIGEEKNKPIFERFKRASDSIFKTYCDEVVRNSGDNSEIDFDEMYSKFPQLVLPKFESESNEDFTERYDNWYDESIISLLRQVQYLIKPPICLFEKMELIEDNLTFDFEAGSNHYELFKDLCPEELINKTFSVIFLVIKIMNITDDLNVIFSNNLDEVQTFNELLWLINLDSGGYDKSEIFESGLKPKVPPYFTKRVLEDETKEDSELKRKYLYANFYHLISTLKNIKASSSLDIFEEYLETMKSSTPANFRLISRNLKCKSSTNHRFNYESILSKNFSEAKKGTQFVKFWDTLFDDEDYQVQNRGVVFKNFQTNFEVRRLNATTTTHIESNDNKTVFDFDTMADDSRSVILEEGHSSNFIENVYKDERIIRNTFSQKLTRNDIEFYAKLEIDGEKINGNTGYAKPIDMVQVEIGKPYFLSTMVKLAMSAINLMVKDDNIDYSLLDENDFYKQLIPKFIKSKEFTSIIESKSLGNLKLVITYTFNVLDKLMKEILLSKSSSFGILSNSHEHIVVELMKRSSNTNRSGSFYSFIDDVKIHYISPHQSINKNKESLMEGLFFLKCQEFIIDNSSVEKFWKNIEDRNRRRLVTVNLLSITQDPIIILKKLIQRNIILKLIIAKLQTNKAIIDQSIEDLEKNSRDICNGLFAKEDDLESINALLVNDKLVLALASQFTSLFNSDKTSIKFSVVNVQDILERSTPIKIIKGANVFRLDLSNVHQMRKNDNTFSIIKTYDPTKIRVKELIRIKFRNRDFFSTLAGSGVQYYDIIKRWLFSDDEGLSLSVKNVQCVQLFQQVNEISSYSRIMETYGSCDFIPELISTGFMANKYHSLKDFEMEELDCNEILRYTESFFIETRFIEDAKDDELKSLPLRFKKSILRNGYESLGKIHRCSIIHGDLQNHDNILITKTGNLKYHVVFIDFGFSTDLLVSSPKDLGKVDKTEDANDVSGSPSTKRRRIHNILNSDNEETQEIEKVLLDEFESEYLGLKRNLEERLGMEVSENHTKLYDTRKLAINDLEHLKNKLKDGQFYL